MRNGQRSDGCLCCARTYLYLFSRPIDAATGTFYTAAAPTSVAAARAGPFRPATARAAALLRG